MSLERMIEKAYDLVQKKRVEQVGEGVYNVVGDHGTYIVARKIDGTISCTCPGFIKRGRCSHSLAVLLIQNPKLLKSIERQISKPQQSRRSRRRQPKTRQRQLNV
ncbi:SWIM zinc finger family protein [Candidatus Bathyarchaeota archaeon]|nr:MAG: SWIM zinc finger family protein [Candidatus Bathyarchaeota archaeon]